jgi:hypothetical protein
MALIIPTGLPVWVRNSDHGTYGGHPSKRNHLSQGVIDALTDLGAEQVSRLFADAAAVGRVAPFAVITFTCNDSGPGAPNILAVSGMIGVRYVSYLGSAAPSGFPSAARNGNGDVTFTFGSSYSDPYGVGGTFVLQHPRASIVGTTGGSAPCEKLADTTVRVRAFQSGGSAFSNATVTLVVHSGS